MLTEENTASLSELKAVISGKLVLVCGNTPKLRENFSEINFSGFAAIAADGAAAFLMNMDIVSEAICTDLNGNYDADSQIDQA
jgi:2-amino-4-hydroxy-6-hydroxymethyldihydropteridine diphosphokinase